MPNKLGGTEIIMLYLIMAVLAAATKGFCGKKVSMNSATMAQCLEVSILRMLFCCGIGVGVIALKGGAVFTADAKTFAIYLISGVSMAVFVVSWLLAIRDCAYVMVSSFITASFIVSVVFGVFLFGESLSAKQGIGAIFILVANIQLIKYNNSIKTKLTARNAVCLFLVFLSQGMVNVSQKMFTAFVSGGDKNVFNFYTFFITLIILCICRLFFHSGEKQKLFSSVKLRDTAYIFVMAAMLFINSYCLVTANEFIKSVILYPLNGILLLSVTTLMSAAFFKEGITRNSAVGIVCTFVALILTK